MTVRFSVLASGSSGNACLLEAHGFGLLLDAGLGPRLLASRLSAIGANWSAIHAVVLTHTHSDHWNDRSFNYLIRPRIPLYCHALHHASLRQASPAFFELRGAGLVQCYEVAAPCRLSPHLICYPLPLKHDDAATCGFRFEVAAHADSPAVAIGYVADLGNWTTELVDVLANVDLLGLEFNHDVHMQETSGRPQMLIERVLGDRGHLSNAQAAGLLREVLRRSRPGRLRHVVQLHLSRHCNRPALALQAARAVVKELEADVAIHTAEQFHAGPSLLLDEVARQQDAVVCNGALRSAMIYQPLLPGFD